MRLRTALRLLTLPRWLWWRLPVRSRAWAVDVFVAQATRVDPGWVA